MFQDVSPFLFTVCLRFLPIHMKAEKFKSQQMAKMNDRKPIKERLVISTVNEILSKSTCMIPPQNLET